MGTAIFIMMSNTSIIRLKCAIFVGLIALLSLPTQSAIIIPLYSDHPIETKLDDTSLNANVLFALERLGNNNFHFEPQSMPQQRAWQQLEQVDACIFNQIQTPEREAKAIFTHFPMSIYPPLRLIVSTASGTDWPTEFDSSHFNLPEKSQIGVVRGNSYGDFLDKVIQEDTAHYFVRSGIESSSRLLDMLIAGRLTGVINYSIAVNSYLASRQLTFPFHSIPILNVEEPTMGYIACSNTPGGKAMVDAMDKVFATAEMQAEFFRFHEAFFGVQEAALLSSFFYGRFDHELP